MKKTYIDSADSTFNGWWGCFPASPGCAKCYAKGLAEKYGRNGLWGQQATRWRTGETNWKQPRKWNRDALRKGKRLRVFTASMADVFEQYRGTGSLDSPLSLDSWRADLFQLIEETPALDWQVLTKRAVEMAEWFCEHDVPENAWLGVSVENQKYADERIPFLCEIPASVRFISCEPLLGPLNLRLYLSEIDWVLVGGEYGSNARPMEVDWVRDIRDQCIAASVPFYFKQWCHETKSEKYRQGRLLDGTEWSQFPSPRTQAT